MYCTNDLEESLKKVVLRSEPVYVLSAWGRAESPDVCCHMDWSGGFVLLLADGGFAYLEGWCDYTGWGCQDGAEIRYSDNIAGLKLREDVKWDKLPQDLNKWITSGRKPWEER